jgi:radical SAM protein with 4Fe4S-binding SPASM domain
MGDSFVSSSSLPDFPLWERLSAKRAPIGFEIELTARCNNDCRHCYINLPAADRQAQSNELSVEEISAIADQAVDLGAMWVLITGGEPLLRKDFPEIYQNLKKKGLLVSVFTNACLITEAHVEMFRKYPPRDIEVTVYGVTQATYEGVTRKPGSYTSFRRGLELLLKNGVKVRLKAMALRSNAHELPEIARFCREHTWDYFRFDPLLHLRYDGNPDRNAEIQAERLSPAEIVAIEQADDDRADKLKKKCAELIVPERSHIECDHLFHCGAGQSNFSVSYDGYFQLCSSLHHPDCIYNLRGGNLADAWYNFTPRVRDMRSNNAEFLEKCRKCPIVNLCLWCPANAHLECGQMDGWSDYFCQVAHTRAESIQAATMPGSRVDVFPQGL